MGWPDRLPHEYRNKNELAEDKKGKAGGNFPLFLGVSEGALKSVHAKWCKISNYSYDTEGSKQTLES